MTTSGSVRRRRDVEENNRAAAFAWLKGSFDLPTLTSRFQPGTARAWEAAVSGGWDGRCRYQVTADIGAAGRVGGDEPDSIASRNCYSRLEHLLLRDAQGAPPSAIT